MSVQPNDDRREVAYHEAAHMVVRYRTRGVLNGSVTIVPDPEGRYLGKAEDYDVDSSNMADMEAKIVSCYAGAEASRKLGCYDASMCQHDDEGAAWARLMERAAPRPGAAGASTYPRRAALV